MMDGKIDFLRMEKPYQREDGEAFWTDLVLSLIRDRTGQPLYVVAMMENITTQHEPPDPTCVTRPSTTPSPACPTVPCSSNAWTRP